ncbi:MAG: hypothetical protein ACHQFX_04610 [Chitinophagales bacterium]
MHAIIAVREVIAIALLLLFSINNEGVESTKNPRAIEGSHSVLASKFDLNSMRFAGSPATQARYLLRKVYFKGVLGDSLTILPQFLDSLMLDILPVITRDELRRYIAEEKIDSMHIGGDISRPLSQTKSGIVAGYFIIHDASNLMNPPYKSFSSLVNSTKWYHNQIWRQKNFKWAHAFINRFGQSITCNDFEKPVYATKFEKSDNNPDIGDTCVGNFIHVENIQPRRSSRKRRPYNDDIAISPGFTDKQYERLALLYLTASTRKEGWLIPSFHAIIDEGIKGAHHDPQNFELTKWVMVMQKLYHQIKM